MPDIYSITGITAYIRSIIESDAPLQDVWLQGEVSNMKAAASGHWYFTLKDAGAQIKCVMFRQQAERQIIEPKDGEAINVHGRISVYEARGEYQLYADEVQPVGGIGDLYQRFEELKAQLLEEGLFDEDRKRPLPAFPLRIGVVTSPDAAAFRDVQNVLARRFPLAEVILSPTLVQGNDAPPLIVKALERINQQNAADVILLVRGGGSIEDLWAFNDERVARAIVASELPVVSGVGHETDFTIADFVADVRAPTPSAAAEVATPDMFDLKQHIQRQLLTLDRVMQDKIAAQRVNLERINRNLQHTSPQRQITTMRQRVDDLGERLLSQQMQMLKLQNERLQARTKALENANPQAILKRGYAIVTRTDDDVIVTQENDAPVGTGITIRLHDGELKARIEDKKSHDRYKRTLF